MYKILIVDDEKMIRMGMKNAICWDKLSIGEVFTAASGTGALNCIKKHSPEIMITDIRMTEMTGLELIESAKKIAPDIRVLVVTGYNDFEYARKSLRLNVQDLFLKPIDEDDLTDAIREQVGYLENTRNIKKNQLLIERTQGSAQQNKLEEIMRSLIHTQKPRKDSLEQLQNIYHFDINTMLRLALIVPELSMDSQPVGNELRSLSIKNTCIGMVDAEGSGITFVDGKGMVAIAFFECQEDKVVSEEIQQLSAILKDETDIKPKIIVGSAVQGFRNLHISYNDAAYLLSNEKNDVRDIIQNLGAESKSNLFLDVFSELKNIMCTNIGNTDYVLKSFDTFTKASKSYNLSKAMTRRCCFELASCTYYSYLENSGDTEVSRLDAFLKNLLTSDKEEACEITRIYISQFLMKSEENGHELIIAAKHYITEHLTEDLSVYNIALHLYVTPSYLSHIFKRNSKQGCNEYITRKRIEKAKYLLENTNMKVGKIAIMIGYHDANYFSLAFKKQTGKSPSKYRETLQ